MSEDVLLAVDVGTGSARAVLFTPEGHQVGFGQEEYTHPGEPGVPGSQVFQTDENWQLIAGCIRTALTEAGVPPDAVRAIAATSMREGMVLYDSAGHEIWACPNVDGRAGAEAAELVQSGAAEEIYAAAGDWVAITAPARFRWLARHEPDLFRSIAHVGMLGDWVTTRLSGVFVTDPSLGSSSGMFDLSNRDWSPRILELCGVSDAIMPPVLDPGTVVGEVTAKAAAETGLYKGTPVVAGGADTQLALVGLGAAEESPFTIVGGSFWQQTAVLTEPVVDPARRLRTLCHAIPGRWMIEGIGFYSGIVMRWFRDAFCEAEKIRAASAGLDVYQLLEEAARELPPGAGGVVGLFSNVMNAKRWVHAAPAFLGFDISGANGNARSACFRAIEEAAAYVSLAHLKIIREISALAIDDVIFTGGAAKGMLWPQVVADVLALPVRVPVIKESTALGAALYAAAGCGLVADAPQAARTHSHYERVFEPDPGAAAAYRQLYESWLEIYKRSLELVEDGLTRPLWQAAGT